MQFIKKNKRRILTAFIPLLILGALILLTAPTLIEGKRFIVDEIRRSPQVYSIAGVITDAKITMLSGDGFLGSCVVTAEIQTASNRGHFVFLANAARDGKNGGSET